MTDSERDDLLVKLSSEIYGLMQEQKLSIARVARRADVTQQTVQSILKAKPCQLGSLLAVLGALRARIDFVITKATDECK